MALLFVSIYRQMARDSGNEAVGAPQMPPLAEWCIEIPLGTSAQSPPFPPMSEFISVKATDACWLAINEDPVAKVNVHPVDAGERLWYGVTPGHCLAVLAA